MEESQRAYVHALKTLTRRDHSEAELRRKLAEKDIPAPVIDATIVRLKESGYLDDRRFAWHWAESAIRNGRGYGYRLRFKLSRRGVADALAAEVTAQLSSEYDEPGTINSLVAKKFPDFSPSSADERQKSRITGYLQRRGFSLSAILNILRGVEGE